MSISAIRSPEDRRRFVDACSSGMPKKQVMNELGISEATYYGWREKWREGGERWVIGERLTRAVRLLATTARTSRREIVELSLQYPSCGPKKLTEMLRRARGYNGTPSTVHGILTQAGLATKQNRVDKLHEKFLKGDPLSEQQRRVVETFDPTVRRKAAKGQGVGDVLTQDVRRFERSSPFGTAQISIVVDTFSGLAFACFAESSDEELASDCLQIAIDELKRRDAVINTIWIDSGYEFGHGRSGHPYTELLRQHKIERRYIETTSSRPNPHVVEVWKDLRNFLCKGGIAEPEKFRECLWKLNPVIREFLDANWNRDEPGR